MSDPFATIPKSIPKKKKKPSDLEAARLKLAALKIKKIPKKTTKTITKKTTKKPTKPITKKIPDDIPDNIIEEVTEDFSKLDISKAKPKPIAKKPKVIAKKSKKVLTKPVEECFCKNKHPTKWYPRCAVCLSRATPQENSEHSKKLGPSNPINMGYTTEYYEGPLSKTIPNPSGITRGPHAYQWMPTVDEMLNPENIENYQRMFRDRDNNFWGVDNKGRSLKPKWLMPGTKPSNKVFI